MYNDLDPKKEMQAIGYDYLCDESGIELKKVGFLDRYDNKYIPKELRKYKEELMKNEK